MNRTAALLASICLLLLLTATSKAAEPSTMAAIAPAFWSWATTPPMGWNSYDAFGDAVTEAEVVANAQYLKEKLLPVGYQYVVIDFRWYDPGATGDDGHINERRAGAALAADAFGRLLPAPNRFPSAANGAGFKALADQLHAMGLKFGIHIMRGIPRQAVKANSAIDGSHFTAGDAVDTQHVCSWCPDMFGVKNNDAGQAWYDSIFRLYAGWGVDFVKVDDLSAPYATGEIEMIRRAIDKSARSIVFSTSPGPTDPHKAQHISTHANMWRISGDFWDKWYKLDDQFDLLWAWRGVGGAGHWPDADMIPFGRIGIRVPLAGGDHQSHFTPEEQKALMTLWCIASSPLMLGMNLPDNDQATLDVISNKEVLAIDQDPLAQPGKRTATFSGGREVWVRELAQGKAIAAFNRGNAPAQIQLREDDLDLSGSYRVHDVRTGKDLDNMDAKPMVVEVPAHGSVLLRLESF